MEEVQQQLQLFLAVLVFFEVFFAVAMCHSPIKTITASINNAVWLKSPDVWVSVKHHASPAVIPDCPQHTHLSLKGIALILSPGGKTPAPVDEQYRFCISGCGQTA